MTNKKIGNSNKKDKRNYSKATCQDCMGTGHYAGKHCPMYKEFLASMKPKLDQYGSDWRKCQHDPFTVFDVGGEYKSKMKDEFAGQETYY
jgi:hypothetical protein